MIQKILSGAIILCTCITLYGQQTDKTRQDSLMAEIKATGSSKNWIKIKPEVSDNVQTFIHDYSGAFGLAANDSMKLLRTDKDALGFTHHRFNQYYKNVRVHSGQLLAHQDDAGNLYLVNGHVHAGLNLDVVPALSTQQAVDVALQSVDANTYYWDIEFWEDQIKNHTKDPEASYYPSPEIVIYKSDNLSSKLVEEYVLTYTLEVRAIDPWIELAMVIDANTGQILRETSLQQNCSNGTVETNYYGTKTVGTESISGGYKLNNDCLTSEGEVHVWDWNNSPPGIVPPNNPAEITSTNNIWNSTTTQKFGASSMYALQRADLYYQNVHNRNSYNNNGGDINLYVNAVYLDSNGNPYTSNASWNGNGNMTVGIGDPDYGFPFECISTDPLEDALNTLDILGHEYTHAVTGSSAGLVYSSESGALNESFSDIFGSMVELNALGTNDWLMGAERCTGYIRNLADPNDENQPDTYGGTYWASTGPNDPDNGGVHTNSGVQNFWFYLLSVGGSGTNDNGVDYDITGIGTTAAALIAYRSLTVYLTSSSNYLDARNGSIQAAGDLFGECSIQQKQVANTWRAVGVGIDFWFESLTLSDIPGFFNVSGSWLATQSIASHDTEITISDGLTQFQAGDHINLNPGFHATAGGTGTIFNAKVRECSDFE